MRCIQTLLILLIVFNCKVAFGQKSSIQTDIEGRFQNLIDSFYNAHPQTKGIAMCIEAPDRSISWCGAIGNANSAGLKLTPDIPANIASNTKTYVAAAIIRLVELNKLKLDQPIRGLISHHNDSLLSADHYDLSSITVLHLLSNTSGIFDFVNTDRFQQMTVSEPYHHWTRDEQIALAISDGDLMWAPGAQFSYSETNYSLLTEIIERLTGKPFYVAMRELLHFQELELNHTWFILQEKQPERVSALAEQFATKYKVNSLTLDPSFDAFGGGGLASTVSDLARFTYYLFNGKVFENIESVPLMLTETATQDEIPSKYYMGIQEREIGGLKTYGHGGFWGTTVQYFPDLNTSIAVFLMERDEWPVYLELIAKVTEVLEQRK